MITVSALPKRGEKATCIRCGLTAGPAPIVLADVKRCANRKLCELRQRRAANRAKAAT